MPINEWENLANAIVVQATKDYRKALKVLKRDPDNKVQQGKIEELENFFYSQWYEGLTRVNADYILEHIREEEGYDA